MDTTDNEAATDQVCILFVSYPPQLADFDPVQDSSALFKELMMMFDDRALKESSTLNLEVNERGTDASSECALTMHKYGSINTMVDAKECDTSRQEFLNRHQACVEKIKRAVDERDKRDAAEKEARESERKKHKELEQELYALTEKLAVFESKEKHRLRNMADLQEEQDTFAFRRMKFVEEKEHFAFEKGSFEKERESLRVKEEEANIKMRDLDHRSAMIDTRIEELGARAAALDHSEHEVSVRDRESSENAQKLQKERKDFAIECRQLESKQQAFDTTLKKNTLVFEEHKEKIKAEKKALNKRDAEVADRERAADVLMEKVKQDRIELEAKETTRKAREVESERHLKDLELKLSNKQAEGRERARREASLRDEKKKLNERQETLKEREARLKEDQGRLKEWESRFYQRERDAMQNEIRLDNVALQLQFREAQVKMQEELVDEENVQKIQRREQILEARYQKLLAQKVERNEVTDLVTRKAAEFDERRQELADRASYLKNWAEDWTAKFDSRGEALDARERSLELRENAMEQSTRWSPDPFDTWPRLSVPNTRR
jgi:hypothetical protein